MTLEEKTITLDYLSTLSPEILSGLHGLITRMSDMVSFVESDAVDSILDMEYLITEVTMHRLADSTQGA